MFCETAVLIGRSGCHSYAQGPPSVVVRIPREQAVQDHSRGFLRLARPPIVALRAQHTGVPMSAPRTLVPQFIVGGNLVQ